MPDPPAPPGPFHANAGPRDGPAPNRDRWPSMGVFADPGGGVAIGQSHPKGHAPDPSDPDRPPWATFRLIIAKVPLPGTWALVGREFVRVTS